MDSEGGHTGFGAGLVGVYGAGASRRSTRPAVRDVYLWDSDIV